MRGSRPRISAVNKPITWVHCLALPPYCGFLASFSAAMRGLASPPMASAFISGLVAGTVGLLWYLAIARVVLRGRHCSRADFQLAFFVGSFIPIGVPWDRIDISGAVRVAVVIGLIVGTMIVAFRLIFIYVDYRIHKIAWNSQSATCH